MYTGTMMDDLFAMVSRAEEHADVQRPLDKLPPVRVEIHATYSYEFAHDEPLEIMGVA